MEKEEDFSIECCRICGAEKEWVNCWQCGGDGGYDEYEEDPVNFAPGELMNEFLKLVREVDR